MLLKIKIQNFVLIKNLEFIPGKQLNVITGETGAGKSILLGALGLVLGNRADIDVLTNKEEKCIVEAEFDIRKLQLKDYFIEKELDYDTHLLLRREINPQGKSRAFVNDTPVNLSILKELGEKLVEVHTQHAGLLIQSASEQLRIVDLFAKNKKELDEYQQLYYSYKSIEKQLQIANEQQKQAAKETDYWQFVFDELEKFNPQANEEITLEEELNILSNSTEIENCITESNYLLKENEFSVLENLQKIKSKIKPWATKNKELEIIYTQIEGCQIELKDLGLQLENLLEKIDANPAKLEELNTRFGQLQLLLKKHGVQSALDLIAEKENLENKLQQFQNFDSEIQRLEIDLKNCSQKMFAAAQKLSESRKIAAKKLEKNSVEILKNLEIRNPQIQIEINQEEHFGIQGIDNLEWKFATNLGSIPQPVSKAASGGEISRLVFAVKTLLAEEQQMPTLIFDEADTGVSGEVASKFGLYLRKMSEFHQVIAITHLPQIAAQGHQHFFVFKNQTTSGSSSDIKLLTDMERIHQIAEMLSGKQPGEAALANARELLSQSN